MLEIINIHTIATAFLLSSIFASILFIAGLLYVFLCDKRNPRDVPLFLSVAIFIFGWVTSWTLARFLPTFPNILILVPIFGTLLASALVLTPLLYRKKFLQKQTWSVLALSLFLFIVILIPNGVHQYLIFNSEGVLQFTPGPFFNAYYITIISMFIYGWFLYIQRIRKTDDGDRVYVLILGLGYITYTLVVIFSQLILPMLNIVTFLNVGPTLIPLILITIYTVVFVRSKKKYYFNPT